MKSTPSGGRGQDLKTSKKVVDKGLGVWYTNKAVSDEGGGQDLEN